MNAGVEFRVPGPLDEGSPFLHACGVKGPPPLHHLSLHQRFRFWILRKLPGAPRRSVSCQVGSTAGSRDQGPLWPPLGARHRRGSGQLVGEGLLQAQRSVVRKRMAVVVFNQSCQVREGHLLVQEHQAILENTGRP